MKRKTGYTKGLAVATATTLIVGCGASLVHASVLNEEIVSIEEQIETPVNDYITSEEVTLEVTDLTAEVVEEVQEVFVEEVQEVAVEEIQEEVVETSVPKHGSRLVSKTGSVLPGDIDEDYLFVTNTTIGDKNYSVVRDFETDTYYFVDTTANANVIIHTFDSVHLPSFVFGTSALYVTTNDSTSVYLNKLGLDGTVKKTVVPNKDGVKTTTMNYLGLSGNSIFVAVRADQDIEGFATTYLVEFNNDLEFYNCHSFAPELLNPRPSISNVVASGDKLTVTVDGNVVVLDRAPKDEEVTPPTPPTEGGDGEGEGTVPPTEILPPTPPTEGGEGEGGDIIPPTEGGDNGDGEITPPTPPTEGGDGEDGEITPPTPPTEGGDGEDGGITPPTEGGDNGETTPPTEGGDNGDTTPPTEDGDKDQDKEEDKDEDKTTPPTTIVTPETGDKNNSTTNGSNNSNATSGNKLPQTGVPQVGALAGLMSLFTGLKLSKKSKK